jgi:hypothetical protein
MFTVKQAIASTSVSLCTYKERGGERERGKAQEEDKSPMHILGQSHRWLPR